MNDDDAPHIDVDASHDDVNARRSEMSTKKRQMKMNNGRKHDEGNGEKTVPYCGVMG